MRKEKSSAALKISLTKSIPTSYPKAKKKTKNKTNNKLIKFRSVVQLIPFNKSLTFNLQPTACMYNTKTMLQGNLLKSGNKFSSIIRFILFAFSSNCLFDLIKDTLVLFAMPARKDWGWQWFPQGRSQKQKTKQQQKKVNTHSQSDTRR